MRKVLQSETLLVVERPISNESWSWIASVMPIAAAFGTPMYMYLINKFGRKVGIVAIVISQALCWIIKLITTSVPGLLVARMFAGVAAGGCFSVIPMYVKEISHDNIRGLLVSLFGINQNVGIPFMYAMGAYFDYYTVLWVVLWLPLALLIFIIKAPESPAFLVKIGKHEAATSTLASLQGRALTDKAVIQEMEKLKNEDAYCKSLPDISVVTILKNKPWRMGVMLLMALCTIQAINGCFAIATYASSILVISGVTLSAELQSLSIPAFMLLGSLVSIVFVDKVGRKPLLIVTYGVSVIAFLVLASVILVQHQGNSVPGWLAVLAIVTAMWSYAAGVSSMPGVIMAETFNFQIRAKVVGYITTYAWLFTFFQVLVYIPISNALGTFTTFYCFAAVNLLGFFVCLVLLPETKGKSIEEIEAVLVGQKNVNKV
ncbi:facilitated trehalose transporter Tret1-like [Aphomia sociella]